MNTTSLNTCIAALGTALQWNRALILFEADRHTAGAVLGALATAHRWEQALQLLRGLQKPEAICCNAAMRACERASEWLSALLLFEDLKPKDRSSPSYCSACSAAASAWHWQRALTLLWLAI